MVNEHITSLGYRLESTDDAVLVHPLLQACNLEPIREVASDAWEPSRYLMACTRAGGIAACVGWTRFPDYVVLHSLAVAPSSRGSGIGGGILACAMADIMDSRPVSAMYLTTPSHSARRLFASAGFGRLEPEEIPPSVLQHPAFVDAGAQSRSMARVYDQPRRGLDNCAFQLVRNDTPHATLPLGSVFFFRQNSNVIEASYRGGPVVRGHLLGAIDGGQLSFCWHQYVEDGRLMSGEGTTDVETLPDGRRELRETISTSNETQTNELLLREV